VGHLNGFLSRGTDQLASPTLREAELVELTTLVGYYGILAVQLRLFRVPLGGGSAPTFHRQEVPQ